MILIKILLAQKLQPNLIQAETSSPSEWLDIVWSLVLLNFADAQQISSVLDDPFVKMVVGEKFTHTHKKQLLINKKLIFRFQSDCICS